MFHVKQTDKKQKRNNEIDRFITEAVLGERVTLKTNSIKIIEYIIGKIRNRQIKYLYIYMVRKKLKLVEKWVI